MCVSLGLTLSLPVSVLSSSSTLVTIRSILESNKDAKGSRARLLHCCQSVTRRRPNRGREGKGQPRTLEQREICFRVSRTSCYGEMRQWHSNGRGEGRGRRRRLAKGYDAHVLIAWLERTRVVHHHSLCPRLVKGGCRFGTFTPPTSSWL